MLLRHSLLYAVGRGLPGIVNFLAIPVFTRLLAPEDYGRYALVIAGVGLANTLLFEWLRISLLRFLALQGGRPERLLSTLVGAFLAVAALSLLPLGAALSALPPEPGLQGLLLVGTGLLWAQGWFDLNLMLARARLQPVRYGLLSATRSLLALGLGVALVLLGLGALGPLLGLLLALLAACLAFMATAWRGARPGGLDRPLLGELLAYALPLTASFLLAQVVNSSDRFLVAWLLGTEATGLYAAGYGLAWAGTTLLLQIVNLAAYPLVVRALEEGGMAAAQARLRDNLLLLLVVAAPSLAGLVALAPQIAEVLLGAAFRGPAAALIPWVALAACLSGLKIYHLDLAFQLGRRTVWQLWIMLAAALLNLALNLALIPAFGLMGAIYATNAAYALAFALALGLGRRVFPLPPPPPEAAKVLLATAAMVAALWPTLGLTGARALAGQVLLAGLAYGLVLLLLDLAGSRRHARRLLAAALARRRGSAAGGAPRGQG